jgi:chromosome segregation ATPase
MKLDTKSWIIIVLFLASGIFLYKWLTTEDKNLKEENKRLSEQVNSIQSERDSLASARKISEVKFDSIQQIVDVEKAKIDKLNKDLLKSKNDLSNAKVDLDKERHKVDEINAQIKKLKETPIKREGVDLLNSLGKKLK